MGIYPVLLPYTAASLPASSSDLHLLCLLSHHNIPTRQIVYCSIVTLLPIGWKVMYDPQVIIVGPIMESEISSCGLGCEIMLLYFLLNSRLTFHACLICQVVFSYAVLLISSQTNLVIFTPELFQGFNC